MIITIVLITAAMGLSVTILLINQPVKQSDMMMGIKIPYGHTEDEDVRNIVTEYKKRTIILWFVFILCLSFLLFLYKYISISLILLTIWYVSYFLLSNSLRSMYIRKMYMNIKKKNLLPETRNYQCHDEDTYWLSGCYSNPNDPRTMVPARFWGGRTINRASPCGRFLRVFLICIVGIVLLRFILLMPIDFGEITVTMADTTAFIEAPKQDFEVKKEEIEKITYEVGIPSMVKMDATDAYRFYLGRYKVSDYGYANVYVYKETPEFIAVTTKNGVVIINAKTSDETKDLYERLLKWVEDY